MGNVKTLKVRKEYVCDKCGKEFTGRQSLHRHVKKKKNPYKRCINPPTARKVQKF